MRLTDLKKALTERGLEVTAGLHPQEGGTVYLIGPSERFWPDFKATPEYADETPDPMDRYSKRLLIPLAADFEAEAVFPSDGPPWPPFVAWALASGSVHSSPVGLLVSARDGLWVSFRGALRFSDRLDLPAPEPAPCVTCTSQPCRNACPVQAFCGKSYDADACRADLHSLTNDCLARGCAVRRACPASALRRRNDEQSAFHMAAFV